MNDYFYIDANGQQKGPIPPTQFAMYGITANTLVWCNGMTDWQRAGAVEELNGWFANHADNASQGTTPPPIPDAETPRQQTAEASANNNAQSLPPCPDNNLVWAILSTLLCCLPTGIVSIVYACKVNNLYLLGDYQGAVDASVKARNWAIGGLIANIVVVFFYFLLCLCLGISTIASMPNI